MLRHLLLLTSVISLLLLLVFDLNIREMRVYAAEKMAPAYKIALKRGMFFDHSKHQNFACTQCHTADLGKISSFGKNWAHSNCKGCHNTMNRGPTKCIGCHTVIKNEFIYCSDCHK